MKDLIANHKNWKELLSKALDGMNPDWMTYNDYHGVDYNFEVSPKDFGLEAGEEFDLAIEELIKDYPELIFSNGKEYGEEPHLSLSGGEEIFIRETDKVILYPEERKQDKYIDELHAYCLIEAWMEESGIYPGVWEGSGHTPREYSFDEDYRDLDKDQREVILKCYDLKKDVANRNHYTYDIETDLIKRFPKNIKDMFEGREDLEIMQVDVGIDELEIEIIVPADAFDTSKDGDEEFPKYNKEELEKNHWIRNIGETIMEGNVNYNITIPLKSNTLSFLENLDTDALGLQGAA